MRREQVDKKRTAEEGKEEVEEEQDEHKRRMRNQTKKMVAKVTILLQWQLFLARKRRNGQNRPGHEATTATGPPAPHFQPEREKRKGEKATAMGSSRRHNKTTKKNGG